MLHLIPPQLHIALLRAAHQLRLQWWRWRRTRVAGAQVVAIDPQGRVLLIRHSYGLHHWTLPGGGLARGESAIAAAVREAREEAGVILAEPVEIAVMRHMPHGSDNDVRVIAGWTSDTPRADGREIVAAQFFAVADLPADIARSLPGLLPGYVTAAKAARQAR
ncbi:MAG: NUDIX domain-containing protein [Novosphingobium sp.]